ncbi:MAG: hypothetical protein PVF95_07370 [bacterium]|jgi:hypothetical protein
MPRLTRYCKYIHEFNEALDSYIRRCHGNRRCSKIRFDIKRALAFTLFTGHADRKSVPRGNLYNLLVRIEKRVALDRYKIPRAWYEKSIYGASKGTVSTRHRVHKREIKCLEALWNELDMHLSEYRDLVADSKTPWRFEVDERHEDMTIRLEDRAIGDMLLLALEGYSVPKGKGTPFTEVYGICLGSTRSSKERRRGHGKHTSHYVHLRGVRTQVRAEGFVDRVDYDLRSVEIQMAVMDYLMLGADIVADFHTHPYDIEKQLVKDKGWRFSEADETTMPPWVSQLKDRQFHPKASLIMALATGKRKIRRPRLIKPNVVRFSIGKHHFYLAAYRICGERYTDRGITLNADTLPGI